MDIPLHGVVLHVFPVPSYADILPNNLINLGGISIEVVEQSEYSSSVKAF